MRWLSDVLKEQYGEKIYKLSLSSGCTCPNRDGTRGYGGCIFCSEGGSGDFAAKLAPINVQIEEAKAKVRAKTSGEHFIAYFQSYTNTYGDLKRLSELYEKTLQREDIAILSIGTRPDCLGDDMVDLLASLNRIKPVWVELGLQTIHEETAKRIRREYPLGVFDDAYRRLKSAGLTVIVHLILGLPGESREDILSSVRYVGNLSPSVDGIKLHMLHILKGTDLGRQYEREPFPMMDLPEYATLIADCLELLPAETVVHRITGDGPKDLLLAPNWTRDKRKVMGTLHQELRKRGLM